VKKFSYRFTGGSVQPGAEQISQYASKNSTKLL
jgi:hypothetical protein